MKCEDYMKITVTWFFIEVSDCNPIRIDIDWILPLEKKRGETAVPVVFFAKDVVCFYFSGVWIVWVYTLSLEKNTACIRNSEAHQASQSIQSEQPKDPSRKASEYQDWGPLKKAFS